MRFRRQYTLYSDKAVKGKPIWYFRVYLPDGTRRAKSTGCTSKEKARIYVEGLLQNETLLRKVFETDLIIKVDSSNSLLQTNIVETNKDELTFEEYASPWWHWDTCPYVLARRSAGTEKHPGIKQSYVKSSEMWTRRYLIPYFGKCKLSDISVDMINSFWQVLKEKHGLSPKTINNIRSVFIIMMKEALGGNAKPLSGGLIVDIFCFQQLHLLNHLPRVTQKFHSFFGEGNTCTAAGKNSHTRFVLYLMHCLGQAWLGDEQNLRSLSDGTIFRHGNHISQLLYRHISFPFKNIGENIAKSMHRRIISLTNCIKLKV